MRRRGWISDYNAQGMEADFLLLFQDAAHAHSRTEGWAPEGAVELVPGQHLTVWDDDEHVLFDGVLALRRMGWFGRRIAAPPRSSGVSVDTWLSWLRRRPALRAELDG